MEFSREEREKILREFVSRHQGEAAGEKAVQAFRDQQDYFEKNRPEIEARLEEEARLEAIERKNQIKQHWVAKRDFLPESFFEILNVQKEIKTTEQESTMLSNWTIDDRFGFFFHGPAGVGKTFYFQQHCASVLNNLVENNFTASSCEYFPVGILLNDLRKNFGGETLERAMRVHFLYLDDLGAEYSTEFAKEHLFTILDTRTVLELPTFITSNLTLDEIKAKYGERISSRIKQLCIVIKVQGEDRRNQVYRDRVQSLIKRNKLSLVNN